MAYDPNDPNQLMLLPASALQAAARRVKKKGHAAQPGTGPTGETCGSCKSYTIREAGAGRYRKCKLTQKNWSFGPGTDIRKMDPACHFWEADPNAKPKRKRAKKAPDSPSQP